MKVLHQLEVSLDDGKKRKLSTIISPDKYSGASWLHSKQFGNFGNLFAILRWRCSGGARRRLPKIRGIGSGWKIRRGIIRGDRRRIIRGVTRSNATLRNSSSELVDYLIWAWVVSCHR